MMTVILLILFFYLLFKLIRSIIRKPFNLKHFLINLLLSFIVFFFLLSFYNREHSLKAKFERENSEKQVRDATTNEIQESSFLSENEYFTNHNFKNKIELIIPKNLDDIIEDENSEIITSKNLNKENVDSETKIMIGNEKNDSDLRQDNFSLLTDEMLEKYRDTNEKMLKKMMPLWGVEQFEITNSSVTTGTSVYGVNFMLLSVELSQRNTKTYSEIIMIPIGEELVRIGCYFPEDKSSDGFEIRKSLKILE